MRLQNCTINSTTHICVFKDLFLSMFRSKDLIILEVFRTATGFYYNCVLIRWLDARDVSLSSQFTETGLNLRGRGEIRVSWKRLRARLDTIMDKMLRQFTKTSTFEVTILFCIWMKTPSSLVVTLSPPPNNVAKRFMDVDLFPTLKKGKGRLPFRRERGEFTPREMVGNFQQLLSMINCRLYWVTMAGKCRSTFLS